MGKGRRHWLVKSEPGDYSITDLERDGTTLWTGVRNYQARNLMRDEMKPGDPVLFYHSGGSAPGVAGEAEVVAGPLPDPTQFDPESRYHDPRATPEAPRWHLVEIRHVRTFDREVPLSELREIPELEGMTLLTRSRLSVQPVPPEAYRIIRALP